MRLYSIPNLSSKKVTQVVVDAPPDVSRPEFEDKAAYRSWCEDAKTDHAFLSPVGGINPLARVTSANPPRFRTGVVAEYDVTPPDNWQECLKKGARPPEWGCRTFSGHTRAWWSFEKPICVVNRALDDAFMVLVHKELKAGKLLPGFEREESMNPGRYFEVGTDWVQTGKPIPQATVEGWLAQACLKVEWKREGTAVPVEKLRAEGEKRFSDRWPGGWDNFGLGTRGVRFWDDSADAESVLVVETGCICFTGDKPFVSWAEIFGADWVRNTNNDALGAAIGGIYYDACTSRYWSNHTACGWAAFAKDDTRIRLAMRGLDPGKARGDTTSEVDRAIIAIQQTRIVDGSFPAFFRPEELIYVNQQRLLNVSRLQLLKPEEGKHKWGEGFPWLAQFFEQMLDDNQRQRYLAWLAHFYQSCLNGRPVRGLHLFLAGPTDCGKTFLNGAVHRQIFGAAGEATAYLTGEDQFNSNLFGCPVWTIDDAVASSDPRGQARFSQAIKALAANDEFTMRGMYREGIRMPWTGRLCVTMNDDPESLRMLPSTEHNLLDKVMLLLARKVSGDFPSDPEVMSELPAFCAYLRDVDKDADIWGNRRFGIQPWYHPMLLETAEMSQDTTSFLELIQIWAERYFGQEGAGAREKEWQGNPTKLNKEINNYDDLRVELDKIAKNAVITGRFLNKLISRGTPGFSFHRNGDKRVYAIGRKVAEEGVMK